MSYGQYLYEQWVRDEIMAEGCKFCLEVEKLDRCICDDEPEEIEEENPMITCTCLNLNCCVC